MSTSRRCQRETSASNRGEGLHLCNFFGVFKDRPDRRVGVGVRLPSSSCRFLLSGELLRGVDVLGATVGPLIITLVTSGVSIEASNLSEGDPV